MSFDKQHVMGAAAEASEPALVSDQAPAGLDPTGFDQAQEVLAMLLQYRDDLRYTPTPDSVERRLAAIEALIAKVQP